MIPMKYEHAETFYGGYARAMFDKMCGFLGPDGNWRVRNTFENLRDMKENRAPYKEEKAWGFIDETDQSLPPTIKAPLFARLPIG